MGFSNRYYGGSSNYPILREPIVTAFDLDLSKYSLGWSDDAEYAFKPEKGLNEQVVEQISWWKGEPKWMRDMRLR